MITSLLFMIYIKERVIEIQRTQLRELCMSLYSPLIPWSTAKTIEDTMRKKHSP